MDKTKEARGRYKPNPAFGGRKEKDGFLCAEKSPWFVFCVAVKRGKRRVQIRDTKDLTDKTLSFSKGEWRTFIDGVKAGEFDV